MQLLDYRMGKGIAAFSTQRPEHGAADIPFVGSAASCPGVSVPVGGVGEFAISADPYAGFNITHYCGDDPAHVATCRATLCSHLGIADDRLILPRQTHTDHIFTLDTSYFETFPELRPRLLDEQDAIVTTLREVCIGVSTADCVPVLMADADAGVIAAVHAGWRGMVKRIVTKTMQRMVQLGASAERIRVVIGPCIMVDSFEVGEEVVDAFLDAGFHPCVLSRLYRRPHIDLLVACAMQLEEVGFDIRNLQCAGVDTFRHPDTFYSARRLGIQSGRIFSGIMLKAD